MATPSDASPPKGKSKKPTDADRLLEFMRQLDHPLKEEVEAVRAIIKGAHPNISERIKWNAPSYYTTADLVTFNLRSFKRVHLVFHHQAITGIDSPLLEGDYKDRRMMYFDNMEAVEQHRKALQRIVHAYVELAEGPK